MERWERIYRRNGWKT